MSSIDDTMDPLRLSSMPCYPISDLPMVCPVVVVVTDMHTYKKVKTCIFVKTIYLAKVGIWNKFITLL